MDLLEANQAVKGRATAQKPGRSKQDFGTPPEFIAAVERRFGRVGFDLAAHADNCVHPQYFSETDDALQHDWAALALPVGQVAWLNPPFGDLRPWAAKCESVRSLNRWTLMLCPASMGSRWWAEHVLGKCQADGITRMTFRGADSMYPKDLALLAYGFGVNGHGFWAWK